MESPLSESENRSRDKSESIIDLHELFLQEFSDLRPERATDNGNSRNAQASRSDKLKSEIESLLKETEGHVNRLENVFKSLDERIKRKTCAAMGDFDKKASEHLQQEKDKSLLDAATTKLNPS